MKMKKNFRIVSFLLISLLLISFSVCTAVAADPKQTLKLGMSTDITTFDMVRFSPTVDLKVGSLVFETLITLDREALDNYLPVLATSWEQKDSKTWIFTLREGVKFTDGTPFNAAAVKFTLERAITPLKSKRFQGMIQVVNIINDYKVEIKLKEVSSSFMSSLTTMTAGMVSPTAVAKYGEDWFKNPVGTGQFILDEWIPGRYIALTRNDDYWGTPARLEKVVLVPIPNEATRVMALKSGEINICEELPTHDVANLEADPNYRVQIQPQVMTVFFALNTLDATLKDKRVRQAIALGIDMNAIHKYTLQELIPEAKYGFLPPQVLKKDELIGYGYDPERAKELLAEAGYADGVEISLWLAAGAHAKNVEICQVVQGQLKEIGIDIKLNMMESGAFWGSVCNHDIDKKHQIIELGWMVNPDPFTTFYGLFRSDAICGFSNYRFSSFDARLLLASKTVSAAERSAMYLAMDKHIVEDVAVIPIYYSVKIYGINEEVQNFVGHPMDFLFLTDTYIK